MLRKAVTEAEENKNALVYLKSILFLLKAWCMHPTIVTHNNEIGAKETRCKSEVQIIFIFCYKNKKKNKEVPCAISL